MKAMKETETVMKRPAGKGICPDCVYVGVPFHYLSPPNLYIYIYIYIYEYDMYIYIYVFVHLYNPPVAMEHARSVCSIATHVLIPE
jgi:hypothetical protein